MSGSRGIVVPLVAGAVLSLAGVARAQGYGPVVPPAYPLAGGASGYLPYGSSGGFIPYRGGPGGGLGVMTGPPAPVRRPPPVPRVGRPPRADLGGPRGALRPLRPLGFTPPSPSRARGRARPPVGSYPFRVPPMPGG